MKIYVNEILEKGLDREEVIKASDLDLDDDRFHYPNGIKVKAHIEKEKEILTVNAIIESKVAVNCSKCLEEFQIPFKKENVFVHELKGEYLVELNDDLRDTIVLDYPIRTLCKPGCKGLCSKCGKNLNQGECDCK